MKIYENGLIGLETPEDVDEFWEYIRITNFEEEFFAL